MTNYRLNMDAWHYKHELIVAQIRKTGDFSLPDIEQAVRKKYGDDPYTLKEEKQPNTAAQAVLDLLRGK